MKGFIAIVCLMLAAGPAFAEHITEGPAGDPIQLPMDREDYCQYGFQDDGVSGGSTLGLGQQLGIECAAPGCITAVGFFVEFLVTPGELDIVIRDDGVEVSRTTIPAGGVVEGVNEFDIEDVNIAGDACIMLCAVDDNNGYWSVTGEDMTNGPFGNTFWSNSCECTNEFVDYNLTIWAVICGATATEETTFGQIRALYR